MAVFNLNGLPDELITVVISKAKAATWLSLQRASKKYRRLVLEHEKTVDWIDIYKDYLIDDVQIEVDEHLLTVNLEKLLPFLVSHFPNLKHLGLGGCPLYLSWSDLTSVANALPALESLDLSQKYRQPKFGFNSLVALAYFRKLQCLILDGLPVDVGSADNCHLEMPPLHLLTQLNRLSINCKSGVIFRVLSKLRRKGITSLPSLSSIRIGGRSKIAVPAKDLEILLWFLVAQRNHLVEVEFCDFVFAANKDAWRVFGECFAMPKLKCLSVYRCTTQTSGFAQYVAPSNLEIRCNKLKKLNLGQSTLYSDYFARQLSLKCPKMIVKRQ